jgi:hypothetical protein
MRTSYELRALEAPYEGGDGSRRAGDGASKKAAASFIRQDLLTYRPSEITQNDKRVAHVLGGLIMPSDFTCSFVARD